MQYSAMLLLLVLQTNRNIPMLMANGTINNIHDSVSKVTSKVKQHKELTESIQRIMEWIKPAAIWKEKGVTAYIRYFY
jgi:hypothetical protein